MDEKGHVNIYSRPLHDFSIENSLPTQFKTLNEISRRLKTTTRSHNMGDRRAEAKKISAR